MKAKPGLSTSRVRGWTSALVSIRVSRLPWRGISGIRHGMTRGLMPFQSSRWKATTIPVKYNAYYLAIRQTSLRLPICFVISKANAVEIVTDGTRSLRATISPQMATPSNRMRSGGESLSTL